MTHARFPALAAGLFSMACASIAISGVNAWTVGGPEGGFTIVAAPHPAQPTIVLSATTGGLYRSTDGGTTWRRSQTPNWVVNDFAFDPTNPDRIFGANNSIVRSDDGGVTFYALANAPTTASGANHVQFNRDGSYLFAASRSNRIYRTPDLGSTWTDITGPWPSSSSIGAMGVDPNAANTLYVAVPGSGVYKSVDAGSTWTPTGAGPATSSVYLINAIVVKPGDSNRIVVSTFDGLYTSSNGGASWSHPYPFATSAVAFDPATPRRVLAIEFDGVVLVSTDSGDSFPGTAANLRAYYQRTHLAFESGTAGRVWVSTADGPLLSTDGGSTFDKRTGGMRAESPRSFTASDDGTAYVVFDGPGGVYKRGVDGWKAVNNNSLMNAGLFSLGYNSGPLTYEVAVAPQDANFLYAVFYNDAIVRSTDGGNSWTFAGSPVLGGNRQFRQIVIDPSDTNIAYAGSQKDGVWKTIDGGQSWNKRSTGLLDNIWALTIDRSNPRVIYAGATGLGTGGVFKSTDGGMNWLPSGALDSSYLVLDLAVDPTNSRVVYAAMGDGLHKSTDAGATWTLLDFGTAVPPGSAGARTIHVDPTSPTTLICGVTAFSGGFLRSVDGGATWRRVDWSTGISVGNGMDTMITDPASPGRVFTGGQGTGIAEYTISNDLLLEGTALPGAGHLSLGQAGTVTFSIGNAGPHEASPAQLRITVPSNLSFAPAAGCTFAAPNLTCAVPALALSDRREVALNFTADAAVATTGTLSAQLITHEPDAVPDNNRLDYPVTTARSADVALGASATGSAQVGAIYTRTLTVTNNGPNATTSTTVTLGFPAGMTATATTTRGSCTSSGATGSCELGGMAAGDTATITLSASAAAAGTADISASVTGPHTDPLIANNSATLSETITAPPPSGGAAGGSGGGKKGGGGLDWVTFGLLGLLLARRRHGRVLARD